MPIMDGFEACNKIYSHLNDLGINIGNSDIPKEEKLSLRVSKTLIYCLTCDYSKQVSEKIAEHPFDGKIFGLSE